MTDRLTSDPSDPRLTHGVDDKPVPMAEAYLVLSEEERAKGFVRPVRRTYVHVGQPGPRFPLRDLSEEERAKPFTRDFVKYEAYPASELPVTGHWWTQADLDNTGKGCGATTTMGLDLAQTYARQPSFYGATYCVGCRMHKAVGEFVWVGVTDERVGT